MMAIVREIKKHSGIFIYDYNVAQSSSLSSGQLILDGGRWHNGYEDRSGEYETNHRGNQQEHDSDSEVFGSTDEFWHCR